MDIEQIIRDNIGRTVHLSLATVKDNKPWVCEVHFAWDDNLNLYFCSKANRRHCQELTENPNVAGNIIDKFDPGIQPLGVYFEGTAEHVTEPEALAEAARVYAGRSGKDPEPIVEEAQNPDGHQLYKITVKNWAVFGKFGDEPGLNKYEFNWDGGAAKQ